MTNDLSLVYNVSLVSLLTAIMSADGDLQRSNMARVATRDGFLFLPSGSEWKSGALDR